LRTASAAVEHAIKTLGKVTYAEQVFGTNPELREVAVAGAHWLTDEFPSKQGIPLLHLGLSRAIERFQQTYGPRTNRNDAMFSWLDEFSSIVYDVPAYMVTGVDKHGERHYWDTLSKPLTEFVTTNRILELDWTPRPVNEQFIHSPEMVRTYFSCHIMNYDLVRALNIEKQGV